MNSYESFKTNVINEYNSSAKSNELFDGPVLQQKFCNKF